MVRSRNTQYGIAILITLIVQVLYSLSYANEATEFEKIGVNALGITEYRFLIEISTPYAKDSIGELFKSAINKCSDSLVHYQYYKSSKGGYPTIPEHFSGGVYLHKNNCLKLFSRYYDTFCVIDSTHICLWSFKSTLTGDFYKGSKGMARKIAKYFVTYNDHARIVKVFKKK
jgi:hypothetical protein